MTSNDFLVFGGGASASVVDQASYAALPARQSGFQSGLAQSRQLNKVWRQSSIMAAVLAQFIADCSGKDALDDGTTQTLLMNLKQAVPVVVNDAGVNSSQKINGGNAANLLFNGSGEFGNAGWGASIFASASGNVGEGTIFLNNAAITSGSSLGDTSSPIQMSPATQLTLSCRIATSGLIAGRIYMNVEAFDASGTSLGVFMGTTPVTISGGWSSYVATGVTPSGTAYVTVRRGADNGPRASVFGIAFGRIKLEQGNGPSLYSQEASLSALAGGMPVVGTARNLSMQIAAASTVATVSANEIVVGSALGGFKYALGGFTQLINLSMTGAGGMDTGAAPANGYVALYAIYDPSTARQALLATDATRTVAPEIYLGANLPSGYTASALVSVVRTNASRQFLPARQLDRAIWIPPVGILGVTVDGGQQWHAIDCSGLFPRNAKAFQGYATAGNDSTGVFNIGVAGDAIGSGNLTSNVASTSSSMQFVNVPILTPQTIFLWYRFLGAPASLAFSFIGTGYTF